jgi:hypothetical protein
MDHNEILSLLLGVLVGALLALVILAAIEENKLDKCRMDHNVYFCKTITVPGK